MNQKIVDAITDKIIAKLEAGEIAWKKPWKTAWPRNYKTMVPYHGINVFVLTMDAADAGFTSSLWLTFNQAKELGGTIKRGSKGSNIIYWKIYLDDVPEVEWTDKQKADYEKTHKWPQKKTPVLKNYYVFNYDQTEGLADKEPKVVHKDRLVAAQAIIDGYKDRPEIKNDSKAFYSPVKDFIGMPVKGLFEIQEQYYSTLFHEMVHSTGHESRLARKEVMERNIFGSEDYSKEELTAEFGSAYLCAEAGIEPKTIENSAAYIQNWLSALKKDKSQLIYAAARAHKAAEYIQGIKGGEAL